MAENLINFEVDLVCRDLCKMMIDCSKRGLRNSASWAAELYHSMVKPNFTQNIPFSGSSIDDSEFSALCLAKAYFDNQEYARAAYFTKECESQEGRFLHYYSTFCSGEKKKTDGIVDISSPVDKTKNIDLRNLKTKLQKEHINSTLDGYSLYLYGVVLKKLQLEKQAVDILCQAIQLEPLHWGSWLELSSLVTDREMLNNLSLPDHWMKNFFLGHTYLELQMSELALEIYIALLNQCSIKSSYIVAQISIVYHNIRDLDKAIQGFQTLLEKDPNRLDNLDIYSNLLYVRDMKVDLSDLAERACKIDKYRVETCCVIGNFYSLKNKHEKAILYFQRALRLNPNYLSAWTLMGHEYMELKNTSFAIQAYRQAIEVNRRDYRAWYGLGQTYESIKMPYYCLYYYKQAQQLRPQDSRMMVALGDAYEKLEKFEEAKKCFFRAHRLGDVDGTAIFKLAKVFERTNQSSQALRAFVDFTRCPTTLVIEDLSYAYSFIAKYYFKCGKLDLAAENAECCLEYAESKEVGNDILKKISSCKVINDEKNNVSFPAGDASSTAMDFSFGS